MKSNREILAELDAARTSPRLGGEHKRFAGKPPSSLAWNSARRYDPRTATLCGFRLQRSRRNYTLRGTLGRDGNHFLAARELRLGSLRASPSGRTRSSSGSVRSDQEAGEVLPQAMYRPKDKSGQAAEQN